LQSLVIGGAQLLPDSTLVGTNLALITGSSYSGLHPTGAAAQAATGSPAPSSGPTTTTPSTATTVSPLPGATANQPACPA
jgi:hypothetical protein